MAISPRNSSHSVPSPNEIPDCDPLPTRFQVLVRFRPLVPWERSSGGSLGYIHFPSDQRLVIDSPFNCSTVPRRQRGRSENAPSSSSRHVSFGFDRIFPPRTSQREVYEEVRPRLLPRILTGRVSVSLIAYGPTCAGKTYTMFRYPEPPHGMCPRLVGDLFDGLEESISSGRVEIRVSMFEVYMEKVIDLLACVEKLGRRKKGRRFGGSGYLHLGVPRSGMTDIASSRPLRHAGSHPELFPKFVRPTTTTGTVGGRKVRFLRVVEDRESGGFELPGIESILATRKEDVLRAISLGNENKKLAQSQLGAESSRSHTVLRLSLSWIVDQDEGDSSAEKNLCWTRRRIQRVNLVDLAGSENVNRTRACGLRLQEARKINHSLSVLGKVIRGLRNHSQHVPFRESKLTMLLKSDLTGTSVTSVILNCSPCRLSVHETLSTLRFGEACLHVGIRPSAARNRLVLPSDARQLQAIVVRQSEEMERLRVRLEEERTKTEALNEQACDMGVRIAQTQARLHVRERELACRPPRDHRSCDSPSPCHDQQPPTESEAEVEILGKETSLGSSEDFSSLWTECREKDAAILSLEDEISSLRSSSIKKDLLLLEANSKRFDLPDYATGMRELREIRQEIMYLLRIRRLTRSSLPSDLADCEDAALLRVLALCESQSPQLSCEECAPGFESPESSESSSVGDPSFPRLKCGVVDVLQKNGVWAERWALRSEDAFRLYESVESVRFVGFSTFPVPPRIQVRPVSSEGDRPTMVVTGRLHDGDTEPLHLRFADEEDRRRWIDALRE